MLKKIAATGVAGVGLGAGTGVASADKTVCTYLTVDGRSGQTDYTVEFKPDEYDLWDPRGTLSTESSDTVNGNTIEGEVSGGYVDRYEDVQTRGLSSVDVNGGKVAMHFGRYGTSECTNTLSSASRLWENILIDISGDGQYVIGYWDPEFEYSGDLSGQNLENDEIGACFIRGAPNRRKVELVCGPEQREGVVTAEVTISDHTGEHTGTYQFGVGEVHGYQYVDTYELADGPPNTSDYPPKFLYLNGDLTVDITYNKDDDL